MKKPYNLISKTLLSRTTRLLVLLLFSLPFGAFAQSISLTPNTPGDPQDFGSVDVGSSSASKPYQVTGSGFSSSDFVRIAIPFAFEGSTDDFGFNSDAHSHIHQDWDKEVQKDQNRDNL